MVVAVAKALEAGARAIICASTGNTSASAAAYGAAAGLEVVVVLPAGKIAARQAAPGAGRRRPGAGGRGQLRRRAAGRPRADRAPEPDAPGHARELRQPVPARGPEDGRLRGLRRPGGAPDSSPSRSATPATSAPTGWASATTATAGLVDDRAAAAAASRPRAPRRSCSATRRAPGDDRHGDPDRRPGERRQGARGRATSRAGASTR